MLQKVLFDQSIIAVFVRARYKAFVCQKDVGFVPYLYYYQDTQTDKGPLTTPPRLSEISKRASGTYFAEKLLSEPTESLLRLLFHLKGRACTPPQGAEWIRRT